MFQFYTPKIRNGEIRMMKFLDYAFSFFDCALAVMKDDVFVF